MKVKICGITNIEDALTAVNFGADAIGFIFYKKSKRFIEYEKAKVIIEKMPSGIDKVGVFVNESEEFINKISDDIGLTIVQLHGEETFETASKINLPVIKAFRINERFDFSILEKFHKFSILLDSKAENEYGGTGIGFDWSLIPDSIKNKIILAGGISEKNIEEVISEINPFMVDLSSSVEISPGKKDKDKLKSFFNKLERVKRK